MATKPTTLLFWLLSLSLAACTHHRTAIGPRGHVVAGESFTCARLASGQVQCCGQGWEGELGNGAFEDEGHVVPVTGLGDATAIAAGDFDACAIRSDGSVWCWGDNRFGQLGIPYPSRSATPVRTAPLDGKATQVSLGVLHSCARMADGTARCWGADSKGEVGTGVASQEPSAPVRVAGIEKVAEVAVGSFHTCARLEGGTVECWGANDSGQLGDGTTRDRLSPAPVVGVSGAVELALGDKHGCARVSGGRVACWGDGQLVAGVVPGIAGAVQIVAHDAWTCARLQAGGVKCWSTGNAPTARLTRWASMGLADVAVGGGHTCGLDANGVLHCEGTDDHGQLCDGVSPPRSSSFPPPPSPPSAP